MENNLDANAVLAIFSKKFTEMKKDLPIRPSEMTVLNVITQSSNQTPVMLADKLGVSKPMITAHVNSLETKGYIVKKPSTDDKRGYYVLPTDKAKQLVASAKTDANSQLESLLNGMGRKNFDTLVELVNVANKLLKDTSS